MKKKLRLLNQLMSSGLDASLLAAMLTLALMLLPLSAGAERYDTHNVPTQDATTANGDYFWSVGYGSGNTQETYSSSWTIASEYVTNQNVVINANDGYVEIHGHAVINGLKGPADNTILKLNKVALSGLQQIGGKDQTLEGTITIRVKDGSNQEVATFTVRDGDQYNSFTNSTGVLWNNNYELEIEFTDCNLSFYQINVFDGIDDSQTQFSWPEAALDDDGDIIEEIKVETTESGLVLTCPYMSDFSFNFPLQPAGTRRFIYESSLTGNETDIVEVDRSTGKVSVTEPGTTVITAMVMDNEDYFNTPSTTKFTYTLNVILSKPQLYGNTYDEGQGFGMELADNPDDTEYYYSVEYAEGVDGTNVSRQLYQGEVLLAGPCTVTAYAQYGDLVSETVTGKLFGFATPEIATPEINVPLGTESVALPAIIPAIEEVDGITVKYYEEKVEDDNEVIVEDGVVNLPESSLGNTLVYAAGLEEGDATSFTLLNHDFYLTINIVPPAPVILDAEFVGDEITITTEMEAGSIHYSWDAEDERGFLYEETPPLAQNGTLYAWVAYTPDSGGDVLTGVKASKEFSPKLNLANAYAEIQEKTVTYTGQTITPQFTVKESKDPDANVIEASNYTVKYERLGQKLELETVEEIKDAGTYMITLTATGDTYGGELIVCEYFQVEPADLSAVTISEIEAQTYTGSDITPEVTAMLGDVTIDAEQYEVRYSDNINAGDATVTLTFITSNFTTSETAKIKTATFQITPAEITEVVLSKTQYEYTGEKITAEVATVKAGTLVLTEDDYEVSENAVRDKGTHTLKVTGKGNFTGELTADFEIVNRKLNLDRDNVVFSASWATYYNKEEEMDLPEGIAAYVVTGVGENAATVTQMAVIPVGVPVLLQEDVAATTGNTSAEGNLMRHADKDTDVSTLSGTVYGLYNGALMRVAAGTIPAGKNYLLVAGTAVASGSAPRLDIVTGQGGATGISVAERQPAVSGDWYTIEGRRLQAEPAQKGIYINNGQKVFVNKK